MIYDVLVCAYSSYAFPQQYSIGFQVCNYALPITGLVVQIFLCLIVKKYIGELEFIQLSERFAVDQEIRFEPSSEIGDTSLLENTSEHERQMRENLSRAIRETIGLDVQ